MRKRVFSAIVVFTVLSVFVGAAFCDEESMSIRYTKYQAEKKEPWVAVLGELCVPTLGYWYADNWPRGIPVLVADIAGLAIALSSVKWETSNSGIIENQQQFMLGYCLLLGSTVFACFDSYAATEEYNKNLMEKYDLKITLNDYRPVLQLSFDF